MARDRKAEPMRTGLMTLLGVGLLCGAVAAGRADGATSDLPAGLPRKGLVAFWSADGHAKDSLGKHHGKIGKGVAFTGDRHGKAKGAFAFNGKSGFVKIADRPELDTDEAFTLSAWINPKAYKDDRGHYSWIMAKMYGSGVRADYLFCLSVTGQVGLSVVENARARKGEGISSPGAIPKNVWTHVAASFDRGRLKLYVNGKLVAAKVSTKVTRTDPGEYTHDEITIGSFWNDHYNFHGAIDEVGIWNRALTDDEAAAAAGLFAYVHVTRLPLTDRVETDDSTVLTGTIQNKQYALETAFGKIEIPAEKVAGIVGGIRSKGATQPKEPFVRLILIDGQVIAGKLPGQKIVFKTSQNSTLKVPVDKLRQCGYGISDARPANPVIAGLLVALRDAQRLRIADGQPILHLRTEWGKAPLLPKSLLRVEPVDAKGARHRAYFIGGSTLTGALPEKLTFKLALGPELVVDRGRVLQIIGAGKQAATAGAATMMLRSGDRLIGRFADKRLTVRTEYGDVKVHAGGIASMQFDANKPAAVAVRLWDATDLKGPLVDAAVALEIVPGVLTLKVPVAKIASIVNPTPVPPPEALKKIEKLIVRLGAESWVDREKAQAELIKTGKSIVPILKKHVNNPDPEIRQRIRVILERLGVKK